MRRGRFDRPPRVRRAPPRRFGVSHVAHHAAKQREVAKEIATSSRIFGRWPSRAPKPDPTLEALWDGDDAPPVPFRASELDGLPEAARRYLRHAIADGAPRARAVRLRMHGMIKIAGWQPFEAEQVIRWQRGFVWRACATVKGLPVHGLDRWIDGAGEMRWKLLGLLPLLSTTGPDISRSALGRLQIDRSRCRRHCSAPASAGKQMMPRTPRRHSPFATRRRDCA